MNRRVLRALLIVSAMVLTAAPVLMFAVVGLTVARTLDPLATVTAFRVTNESGWPIQFWPVGGPREDLRSILPLYWATTPAIPNIVGTGRFDLAPGKSAEVRYDSDGIYVAQLLIRDSAGRHLLLAIGRGSEHFVPSLDQLNAAPPALVARVVAQSRLPIRLSLLGLAATVAAIATWWAQAQPRPGIRSAA